MIKVQSFLKTTKFMVLMLLSICFVHEFSVAESYHCKALFLTSKNSFRKSTLEKIHKLGGKFASVESVDLVHVYRGLSISPEKFKPGYTRFHNFASRGEMYVTSSLTDAVGYSSEDAQFSTVLEFYFPRSVIGDGATAQDDSFTQYTVNVKSAKDVVPFIARIGAVMEGVRGKKIVWFNSKNHFKELKYLPITEDQISRQARNLKNVQVLGEDEWINEKD